MRTAFDAVLTRHALAAQASEYDRSVAVTAIAAARAVITGAAVEGSAGDYGRTVYAAVASLHQTYNDPDGEYTNGRGVLGSLLGDLYDVVRTVTAQ
ncbi:MAG: hypothetical protein HKN11_19495 [Rhizobiales bacterium]|nr:hypothetical protein [Hyphomicrobiales bacterium]